ncbi:hypothetical protein AB0I22_19705 [Streptomyces sp. NPDC050610]|uniref:hypothetical protein n=1 Tax=Streptomyces sp. NPDC050610 TaxID=3157097 RepID=UPI0034346FE2
MDLLPRSLSLALFAVVGVCALVFMAVRIASARNERDEGFASKAQLKRQLSAKAALKATEIRPSLHNRDHPPARSEPVNLHKRTHSAPR